GGYSKAVTLSVPNCPSGATCSFSANPATAAANGSITSGLTITGAAVGGPYSLTISGTDGTLTHTTPFSLTVTPPSDFSISASPSSATATSVNTPCLPVALPISGGYSKAVTLSVPNCPSGATCSF